MRLGTILFYILGFAGLLGGLIMNDWMLALIGFGSGCLAIGREWLHMQYIAREKAIADGTFHAMNGERTL